MCSMALFLQRKKHIYHLYAYLCMDRKCVEMPAFFIVFTSLEKVYRVYIVFFIKFHTFEFVLNVGFYYFEIIVDS